MRRRLPTIRRQTQAAALLLAAGLLSGCQTFGTDGLVASSAPAELSAPAASAVAGDLVPRFAEQIDASAQKQGLIQADAYMAHLRWGEEAERAGTPAEVAAAVKQELETQFS